MNCPFCLHPMRDVYDKPTNANSKIIDVYVCLDCQQPVHETYYRVVCDSGTSNINSDQFVIDKFYVYRSYDSVKSRTAIYKNIAGILRGRTVEDNIVVSAITIYPPVCILKGVVQFNFSNINELKNKLNMLVNFS